MFPALADDWRFYLKLKQCDSRMGRELFSGPAHFFCAILLWRMLLGPLISILKATLPPAQLEALRTFSRRRAKVD